MRITDLFSRLKCSGEGIKIDAKFSRTCSDQGQVVMDSISVRTVLGQC